MDKYAVVGNPINHSLSPRIHSLFAAETNQQLEYQALELDPDQFEHQVAELIEAGFKGINITVPFKEKAWAIADKLSPRASDAGAVNTLIFQDDGLIAGDNTDGIGLTRDMITNHHILIKHRKILVLGAGGAVRGILGPLLAQKPGLVTITNRTVAKADELVEQFRPGSIDNTEIQSCSYEDLGNEKFDLIINGTSAGLHNEVPPIPDELLGINSICYDMMYNIEKPTAFVQWALDRGALRQFDGLGMLVEQAAEAFFIWRGIRPDTQEVLATLRQN
ncbi:MAG: shikimate dehydrogenase [Gammaproteobacteria bacterium]|jgi:shikimate dehydrogenase|nr:shikimate dehydrogenase [Gammaproteobacteria bacterium]MBT4076448.1 shikimate dehydrogenase [Gammaproteobacteria bacterium]MBT4196088.1 shikimate dehydrogenase [Gammaproteobacteria bacterium]MBT4448834.1 shikimate dehydrogenase [Gammaproteobacteria bacterium]MBT4861399.1 shikimate dehydrogenase [Gammaproteobacteria bacterium]